MLYQTLIIVVVIAAVAVALLFWYAKKSERKVSITGQNRNDPLTVAEPGPAPDVERAERVEPELKMTDGPDEEDTDETSDESGEKTTSGSEWQPSDDPPVYGKYDEAAKRSPGRNGPAAAPSDGRETPPMDRGIEWILHVVSRDGAPFAMGEVESLPSELESLRLPLAVQVWAKSVRDGLWHKAERLSGPASEVSASVMFANRTAALDDVSASNFFQRVERFAICYGATVDASYESAQAVAIARQIRMLVEVLNAEMRVYLRPVDPESGPFTLEAVGEAALGSGFTSGSGRWEWRSAPADHEPVFTLGFAEEGVKSLYLAFDMPLASLSRGDLKKFFATANHLSAVLGAYWCDAGGRSIDAASALLIEEQVAAHGVRMRQRNIVPGSQRAARLFSRGV